MRDDKDWKDGRYGWMPTDNGPKNGLRKCGKRSSGRLLCWSEGAHEAPAPLVAGERPSHGCPRVLRDPTEEKSAIASPVQVRAQGNGKESREGVSEERKERSRFGTRKKRKQLLEKRIAITDHKIFSSLPPMIELRMNVFDPPFLLRRSRCLG